MASFWEQFISIFKGTTKKKKKKDTPRRRSFVSEKAKKETHKPAKRSAPTPSRKGRQANPEVVKRGQTLGTQAVKQHKQYEAYRAKKKAQQNKKDMQILQRTTGQKYKHNQEIKPAVYTGNPEDYAKYRVNAKVIDKTKDKTVYDKKTGTSKGVTLKEYYSAPEHKKEALKEKKKTEKFINDHPVAAGFGDAYSKLVGRGVEDYKDIFSGIKGTKKERTLDTKKYDKSKGAKIANMAGVASQYLLTGGTSSGIKAGATAGAKMLGKLTAKKGAKTIAKAVTKKALKEGAKKTTKKLSKEGIKKFAKNRAAEVAADMPLDIAHSYKDSKGDTKEFAKNMGLNVAMNVGVGGGAEYLGKGVKALKNKAVAKSAMKKATKNRKETAKAVKGALESLENRAKAQGDYLSDLRTKMGVKTKTAPKQKPVKGKTVKKAKAETELTIENIRTGKKITGRPRNKQEAQMMLRVASRGAKSTDDIRTTTREVGSPQARTRNTSKEIPDREIIGEPLRKEDIDKLPTRPIKDSEIEEGARGLEKEWDDSPVNTTADYNKGLKSVKTSKVREKKVEELLPSNHKLNGNTKEISKDIDDDISEIVARRSAGDMQGADGLERDLARKLAEEDKYIYDKGLDTSSDYRVIKDYVSNKPFYPPEGMTVKEAQEMFGARNPEAKGVIKFVKRNGKRKGREIDVLAGEFDDLFPGVLKNKGNTEDILGDIREYLEGGYNKDLSLMGELQGKELDDLVNMKRDSIRSAVEDIEKDIAKSETPKVKENATNTAPKKASAEPPKNEPPESELDKEWKAKGKEYGTYDKANTPRQTDEQTHTHKALDTAMSEKPGKEGIVKDEGVKQNIKRSVLEQEVGFTRRSQKDALDAAYKRVEKDPEKVRQQFNETLSAKDTDVANGVALYEHYMKQGDIEAASDVIKKVSMQLTEAGRGVNAAKMLMRTTPAGRVKAAQGLTEKLTEKFSKRLEGKEITLSDETIKRINDAKTEKEILDANEAARVEIWNQIPASWGEKFNAWRYIAMLANPKTHVRNIIGNALFAVPREVKNIIGAGVESLAEKAKLIEKGDRTKALINPFSESDKKLLDFGGKNFDVNEPILRGQSRWNDSARPEDSVVFKNPILEKLRKANGGVLDKEDILFMKPAYRTAMARYMKANGLTAADMTGDVLKKAEAVASEEALKATYRDANAFASWLSKTKNVAPDASRPRKLGAVVVESIVPFAKTPTNILRRGLEYSPVGLMQGMTNIGRALARKDGQMLVEAIDRMAGGLTGSGILGLGYMLNRNGLVTVEVGNDSEGNFRKGLGEQNYALKFGDSSFTLDWAAPMSMPFFVGANISEQTKNHDLSFKDVLNSLGDIMNPVAEMSMLQGLTNTMGTMAGSQSGGAKIESALIGIGTNYASQAVPTISGQLARIFDNTQRSTTSTEEGTAMRSLDKFQKQMRAKVPGLSRTLEPALDSWGNEKKYGSTTERVLENFVSPGYYSENKATAVDKKLLKLADDLGEDEKSKIFPKGLTGYNLRFNGNDVRVTPQALTMYNKVKGKEAYNKVKTLMKSDEYKKMSNTDKVKAISNIYTDAGVWAKQESLISMGKDKFKVRTDDWENKDAVKAAKEYNSKHDIDDIVNINKQLDDLGFSTSRNRQTNIKAIAVAESDKANKDLYKYYNVDKATQKVIKRYKASGGSLKELGGVQKSIDATAKTVGKRANELPKGALAYALAAASGKNRIYQMYDESTPLSKGYWEHSVRSGKGMAATGLTLKDRQKAYDATKGASGHPSKDAIINYLDKKNWTQEQKSYMFWQLANWNTKENPYGDYTPKFNPKKTKSSGKSGQIDYSTPEAKAFFNKFGANMSKERLELAQKLYKAAKASKKGINAPYSNDKDYLPKETLQVVRSGDKELDAEALKALKNGGLKNIIRKANATLPKVKEPEDSDSIFGDGKEGSSSGGGYYRRYGRGYRRYGRGGGGRGGSGGGTTDTGIDEVKATPNKTKTYDWTPKDFKSKPGWTDAQIRKVFNALIKQGLTEQQAVSRIASLWNTRFS